MEILDEDFTSLGMSLEEFLRNRGISEDIISYCLKEKIDCGTINIMTDIELKSIIPTHGDRVAIKNFSKKKTSIVSKQSLIERLKEKMKGNKTEATATGSSVKKQRTGIKRTRMVEIGWMNYNRKENRYRQVRLTKGGGTRRVSVDRNSKCHEILKIGKELFFPNGRSTKGTTEQFNIELLDYKSHSFDTNMTVQDMYEISALSNIRFYVATTFKEEEQSDEDCDYIPASTSVSQVNQNAFIHRSSERIQQNTVVEYISQFNDDSIYEFELDENQNLPDGTLNSSLTDVPSTNYESYSIVETDLPDDVYQLPQSDNLQTDIQNFDREENKLILHRGKVFEECIEALKTRDFHDFKTIKIEMILPNGVPEIAEDLGGVLRDAISEFWEEFYEKCTIGTDYKVPFLRHDFGEAEWRAIWKFLVKGWESEGYFPIKIAPVFIKYCFKQEIEADDILNNFLEYICESEAKILKKALEDFDCVEFEDILEFVGNYDSKWLPTKTNFRRLLADIAHKEIIQKPAFVCQCFSQELRGPIRDCDLENIYRELNPSVKTILSKFEVSEDNLTSEKINIYGYLKKFIKELDEKSRSAFLRFCTGSNLPIKNIQVHFIDTEGIARSPIAHTCTGMLELPTSYENFVIFRNEFNNLLNSNIWIMDIV